MTKTKEEKAAEEKAAAEKKAREDAATAEKARVLARTAPIPKLAAKGTKIPKGMSAYSTRLKEEMPEVVKKALSKIDGKVLDWAAKDEGTIVVTEKGQRYLIKGDGTVVPPKQPPKRKPAKKEAE